MLDHVQLVVRVGEPVEDHRVDQLAVPEPVAEASLLQQVRRVRHRLHPAGDDHVVLAGADHRVRDLDGADRRGADLVDRVGGRLLRQPGADRRLPRGSLAGARLQHLAHDHVLGLAVLEADPLERRLDHDRAELRRLVAGEAAAELPERRADGGDDDGAGHAFEVTGRRSRRAPASSRTRRAAGCTPRGRRAGRSRSASACCEAGSRRARSGSPRGTRR